MRRRKQDGSSDSALALVVREGEAAVAATREKQAAGTASSADYRQATEAAKQAQAARRELAGRERVATSARAKRAVQREERNLIAGLGLRSSRLKAAARYDVDILEGATLNAALVTDAELDELGTMLRARHAEGELSAADERRWEKIMGTAAGDVKLFARRRSEIKREAARLAEAERLHRAMLPRRRQPEPGSIELPRFLFDWVTDGKDNTFDLADLGVLAGLLFAFANESAAMFGNGRFAHVEGVPTIEVRDAAYSVDLTRSADADGRLQVQASLGVLARNKWIVTRRDGGLLHIQPGEKMRKQMEEGS